jgi:hypothetical protein
MNSGESSDQAIKRYEELYRYAKDNYAQEMARFEGAEGKVARYLTVIGFLLGAGAIGIDKAVLVFRATDSQRIVQGFFGVSYGLFWLSGIVALYLCLNALKVVNVSGPPLDDKIVDHFDNNSYLDTIHSVGRRFLEAANRARNQAERKLERLAMAHRLLSATWVFALATAVTYIFLIASVLTLK